MGIGINYDCAFVTDQARQDIRGEYYHELSHVTQGARYVSRVHLKVCRHCLQIIYANGIVKFEIEYTRDRSGKRLAEF